MKKLFAISAALMCTLMLSAGPLSLRVQPITGNAVQNVLTSIGKVVYSGDSIYVYDLAQNALYKSKLAEVQNVAYTTDEQEQPTAITNNETQVQLLVYPNPTQGLLQVNKAEGDNVRIYDMKGQLLITNTLQDGSATINVTNLANGNYILLVQNGVFQFIKQ